MESVLAPERAAINVSEKEFVIRLFSLQEFLY